VFSCQVEYFGAISYLHVCSLHLINMDNASVQAMYRGSSCLPTRSTSL